MNCEECPFIGGTKVYGEGSRIQREWVEETHPWRDGQEDTSITFRTKHVERDSKGQYDVVVVAMAPAREEVREGRVLIGMSGQIVRNTLKQLGIEEFYLCNVLLCPIPEGTKDFVTQQAVTCCRDVDKEVLDRKPKLVIALGELPYRKFTDNFDYTISEVEGRVLPSKVGPLAPLLHPAFYLRRPQEFMDFIECMRSSVRYLSGTYVQAGNPTLTVVSPDNLNEVRNKLDKYEDMAIDLETTGLHAYGWEPHSILEMGLAVEPNNAYIVPSELVPEFKGLLEEKKGVYWNAPFDAAFLKQLGISPNVDFDGMIGHYTMDERGHGHSLKKVGRIYLGCDDWSKDIEAYLPGKLGGEVNYSAIPTDIRYGYLSKDVTRTLQLKGVLWNDINHKVFDSLLMPACRMFIEIKHRGQRVDPMQIMNMDEILTEDIDRLDRELHELTKEWINPKSWKQVRELVYMKMGLPVDPFFGMSTGKDALDPYKDNPIIGNILDQRSLYHTRGHYIDQFARFIDHNFRIHPSINLTKAVTGRLSSDDPNIMNIKRDSRLKEIFLPDIGEFIGYGDIKGNELRWYGIIGKDEDLLKILREGGDPHHIVAIEAYGEELARELRTEAKAVVFGRMYKRGRKSIEYQVGSERIDRLMEAVDGVFPNIKGYYSDVMEELKLGYLTSFFERRRRFPLITQQSRHHIERQGVNFNPQSSGSDLMLYCMLHMWENKDKWGIWPFWPVHDSLTWNMKDKEMLPLIKQELENYSYELVNGICPFTWEVDWGVDWSMRKPDNLDEYFKTQRSRIVQGV